MSDEAKKTKTRKILTWVIVGVVVVGLIVVVVIIAVQVQKKKKKALEQQKAEEARILLEQQKQKNNTTAPFTVPDFLSGLSRAPPQVTTTTTTNQPRIFATQAATAPVSTTTALSELPKTEEKYPKGEESEAMRQFRQQSEQVEANRIAEEKRKAVEVVSRPVPSTLPSKPDINNDLRFTPRPKPMTN